MAKTTDGPKADGNFAGFAVLLIALALLGGGAGFGLRFLLPPIPPAGVGADGKSVVAVDVHGDHRAGSVPDKDSSAADQIVPLEPIHVTLAEPDGSWLRLEAAVVFTAASKENRTVLVREMTADLMAFLRTVKLSQIAGGSGLEYLREDLNELVQLRSNGQASGLVLKTLMVE